MKNKLRLAILDMNNKTRNLGMTNIQDVVKKFNEDIEYQVFEVRSEVQIPDLSFDIYIFSGGPGDPRVGEDAWLIPFNELLDQLYDHNREGRGTKKYCFFICHSFQMACHHFQVGTITPRREKSFGTFPVYKTEEGKAEWLFQNLSDPFWVADFRSFQVIEPRLKEMEEKGMSLILIERERPHPALPRAIMGVRFSEEMIGTQFHPEADPEGMRVYFSEEERVKAILEEFGEDRYFSMLDDLKDSTKIARTHSIVLPFFLHKSIQKIREANLTLA